MGDIKYEIVEAGGIIKMQENGSSQQVNLVSWNGAPAKLDIRNWSPTQTPWKGISIDKEDIGTVIQLLEGIRDRMEPEE